ncbi:MAG: DNA-binding protein [Thermoprotei archaeon]|nr:MAG: DNA-binding protein [Thermoprotei archaeon]
MSLDPLDELLYRYRLATQHLSRSERLYSLGDWAGAVQFAQLAIENFAKALIALYEIPTWSHDPSSQLLRLMERFPEELRSMVSEIAEAAREVASEHGRSTYGEPSMRLTPAEIYTKQDAQRILNLARRIHRIIRMVFEQLNVHI